MHLVQVIDDVLPIPHLPEIQGPAVELIKRSLQPDIQPRVAHPHTDGLVASVEEDPMDLQALASLPMGFHMEEVEIEAGHPHQHEEGDSEPGEIQSLSNLGEREDRQSPDEGKKPKGEPGPARPMTGKIDEYENPNSNTAPESQAQSEPTNLQHISQATHCASAMR